jgi:hypothetical protein
MSYDALGMDIAFLFVLIFVMVMITVPRKGDTKATRVMRQIGRLTFTVTMGVAIALTAFALYVMRTHQ